MALSVVKWVSLGVATSVLAYANLPTSFYSIKKASVELLVTAQLKELSMAENVPKITAGDLWKTSGAVVMAVRRPG